MNDKNMAHRTIMINPTASACKELVLP